MNKLIACIVVAALFVPVMASDGESKGDTRNISFTLPFKDAYAKAKAENRLLFFKPVYGGVDQAGSEDYRTGSW